MSRTSSHMLPNGQANINLYGGEALEPKLKVLGNRESTLDKLDDLEKELTTQFENGAISEERYEDLLVGVFKKRNSLFKPTPEEKLIERLEKKVRANEEVMFKKEQELREIEEERSKAELSSRQEVVGFFIKNLWITLPLIYLIFTVITK